MTTFPHYITTLDHLPLKNIFFPAEIPSNKLMILLHGRGGATKDFSWIAETFDFEDMHYLLLNAPNDYEDGYSWYENLDGIKNASTVLNKTLDILFEKEFDASQSFLFGFSQGALLTFEFGARYKKPLAGYIAISGHISNPHLLCQEMHPTLRDSNWLCTHGTKDEALDFDIAKQQVEILKKDGFSITFKAYNKAHVILKEEIDMIQTWMKGITLLNN